MTKVALTLDLPDRVAREAEKAGLLTARAVARLLRGEIKRQAAGRLLAGADRARRAGVTAMSPAELRREIDAVRTARRPGVPAAE